MRIFETVAPAYFKRGLSVLPLERKSKKPAADWRMYINAEFIPDNVQALWTSMYPEGNIGLIMGPPSGVMCIDVDIEDERVHKALEAVLPKSPWKRVGQKGFMWAYKWNDKVPSTFIKDKNNKNLIEVKAKGTQIVIPPSIHPDTLKPYVANCELLDVIDQLPELPFDVVDRIRAAIAPYVELGSKTAKFNSLEFIPTGARDNKLTQFAGQLSYSVFRENTALKLAINTMVSWCENMVAKNGADNISPEKGVAKLVEFIQKDLGRGKLLPPGWDDDLSDEVKKQLGLDIHEDQQEWTVVQFKKYLTEQYNNVEFSDETEKYKIMYKVLSKLAVSTSLDSLQLNMICKDLKDLSGLKVTEAAIKKQVMEMRRGPVQGNSHTEIARVVIEKFEESMGKLALDGDVLHSWNGSHWEEVSETEIRRIIQCEFGDLLMSKKYSDHTQIVKVIKDQVPHYLTAQPTEGVNFDNGFLTKSLELIPHQPEYGMKYTLPYQYKPGISHQCPKFLDYLHFSWGHHKDYEDKLLALKEAICATFFGISTSFQRVFLLYSQDGGTGKSVLMDIISNLVPENTRCALSPEKWNDKFSPATFHGKLLNQAGELHEFLNIEGKIFKQVVDGSPITASYKHRDEFTFRVKCAHWFSSNYLPKTKDTSSGFNRRWLFFTFDRKVPENEKILDLGYIIASEEIEAIVAWATEAMPKLMERQNFTLPKSHLEFSREMELQNSTIRQFVERAISFKKGVENSEESLYKDYYTFVVGVIRDRPVNKQKFAMEIRSALMEVGLLNFDDSKGVRNYLDIKVEKI